MNRFQHLNFYASLSRLKSLKKSYPAKMILVAFLGTNVPLLALILSMTLSNMYSWDQAVQVIRITIFATLFGTASTVYALCQLLRPVVLTSVALQNYLHNQTLPELPTQFPDEVGTLMKNTTQALYQLDELLHRVTHYDSLTGLPNRQLFCDRFQKQLLKTSRPTVLLLSLDDFTAISNTLGHSASNILLGQVSQRLFVSLGQSCAILAHLSADEFAIALIDYSIEKIVDQSQTLLSTFKKSFTIEDQSIRITASIGISLNSGSQQDVEKLLQHAQIALYQAKEKGRCQYQFYSPDINAQLQERLTLENDLHQALANHEITIHYQPLIDLKTQKIVALEALVRWQHPTRGLLSPTKFIPIAEASGLILSIGEWILRTACAQNHAWQTAGLPPIRMSVNLSGRQFDHPNLVQTVSQILMETGLAPTYLELEVTESFLMEDVERSIDLLTQLKATGIMIALDDFGTGYSSLSYLKQFPVNMLKIDRSFIHDVASNPNSAAVTDAIIALAKSLNLGITAEGIEAQEQVDYLQLRGCHEGQGFYFSRPLPVDQITQLLIDNAA